MTPSRLPERPDLGQLRRQAKDLRDAARAGEPAALERLGDLPATLAAAQLSIARGYGFASWPKLKTEVETRTMSLAERVGAFLDASVNGQVGQAGRGGHATRLLERDPGIAGFDIRTAAVLGDAQRVRDLLARDPAQAVRPDPRNGLTPLLFVCNSRWHHVDPGRADGMLEVARLLLDHGASPDTRVGVAPRPGHCSALYAAAGLAGNPTLTRLLLERGADPDTHSALYHTAFHEEPECMRLLLEHGARAEGGNALGAAISVGNAKAARLLVEAGIDPRQPIPADSMAEVDPSTPPVPAVYAAIEFDCGSELIELLLRHGADPVEGGRSSYRLAVRRARTDLMPVLRRFGAEDDATATDHLLGACLRADRAEAQRILGEHPGLLDRLTGEERATIAHAADRGDADAVALMLDLGFPIDARVGDDGITVLHAAAASGSAGTVRLLIRRGADLEARDATWDSTPLVWATVGSGLNLGHDPGPDWPATVQALIDAGASTEDAWVGGKPPSDEVAAVLRGHGVPGD